ncbi:MAG: hypothetical protein B6D68_03585 [spirochete symbiont of Stewartia floridana]|nr:MAG: hypothetical protein B6D68_03585 [spirochete symbiont of Stewartia floridana]
MVAANSADDSLTYSTSDNTVAAVTDTGELTIAAAGDVTITALSTFDTSVKADQVITIARKAIGPGNVTYNAISGTYGTAITPGHL